MSSQSEIIQVARELIANNDPLIADLIQRLNRTRASVVYKIIFDKHSEILPALKAAYDAITAEDERERVVVWEQQAFEMVDFLSFARWANTVVPDAYNVADLERRLTIEPEEVAEYLWVNEGTVEVREYPSRLAALVTPSVRLTTDQQDGLLAVSPTNGDGAHWGLTDLYEDFRATLLGLWEMGVDFKTTYASKKEILSAKIVRVGGQATVSVHQSCDEGPDLVSDMIWELAVAADLRGGDGEEYLRSKGVEDMEKFIDFVVDRINDDPYSQIQINDPSFEAERKGEFASLDAVLAVIGEMEGETDKESEANAEALKEYVLALAEEFKNRDDDGEDDGQD